MSNLLQVDIGIPHELWDKPSAEVRWREGGGDIFRKLNQQVTQLKTQCETLLEKHEEDIEDWYFEKQDEVKSSIALVSLLTFDTRCPLRNMFVDKGLLKKEKTLVWSSSCKS